jgi:hypothetical protein
VPPADFARLRAGVVGAAPAAFGSGAIFFTAPAFRHEKTFLAS